MTLKDAKKLRDEIREYGLHSIVPLGHGPDGYFARIFTNKGDRDFRTRRAWLAYRRQSDKEQRERAKLIARYELAYQLRSRPRSPIEIMIDRACGLE